MKKILLISFLFISFVAVGAGCADKLERSQDGAKRIDKEVNRNIGKFKDFKTNTTKSSIDFNSVLSGGPGKDGIPAIDNPRFKSISDSKIDDSVLGIFVNFGNESRFYPYNILVWHEIVNDSVGDKDYAVTFCPLCGSAVVYDRNIGGELLDFGVSGFLYESNLLMYDRQTESFWSQALGESVIGEYTGTELEILPMQLITFGELKQKYPQSKVLSDDTGHRRNYDFYPYGNYEETDELLFEVSVRDKRFFAKEIMYVVPFEDKSFAFPQNSLKESKVLKEGDLNIEIKLEDSELFVFINGKRYPGYYEMWFSWATHHQEDGIVLDI